MKSDRVAPSPAAALDNENAAAAAAASPQPLTAASFFFVELVHVLDRAPEAGLFARSLATAPPRESERVSELIRRVRLAPPRTPLGESLERAFAVGAAPAILAVLQPANVARQSIQSLDSFPAQAAAALRAAQRSLRTGDGGDDDDNNSEGGVAIAGAVKCDGVASASSSSAPAVGTMSQQRLPCTLQRLCISGRAGASNRALLAHFAVTDAVRCCELPPPGGDLFSGAHLLIAGIVDDDAAADIAEPVDRALAFVKERLAASADARVLIHCAAGRHRSAWFAACIVAALARDPSLACACLRQRTRYHSSLGFAARRVVESARGFVEFSPAAQLAVDRWIAARRLPAAEPVPDDDESATDAA